VRLAHRKKLVIESAGGPYIGSLSLDGKAHDRPWLRYCEVAGGGTLAYATSSHATRWAQHGQLPPSYGPGTPVPKNTCSP
jgi:putative alpha-1,2-mannosidase